MTWRNSPFELGWHRLNEVYYSFSWFVTRHKFHSNSSGHDCHTILRRKWICKWENLAYFLPFFFTGKKWWNFTSLILMTAVTLENVWMGKKKAFFNSHEKRHWSTIIQTIQAMRHQLLCWVESPERISLFCSSNLHINLHRAPKTPKIFFLHLKLRFIKIVRLGLDFGSVQRMFCKCLKYAD